MFIKTIAIIGQKNYYKNNEMWKCADEKNDNKKLFEKNKVKISKTISFITLI